MRRVISQIRRFHCAGSPDVPCRGGANFRSALVPLVATCLGLLVAACPGGGPSVPSNPPVGEPREPRPAVRELAGVFRTTYPSAAVSWDQHSGFVEQLSSFLGPVPQPAADPGTAARAFIVKNAGLFGIDPEADNLEVRSVQEALAQDGKQIRGRFVSLVQLRERLPVFEAVAVVNLTASNRVYTVHNSLRHLQTVEGKLALSQQEAIERARAAVRDRPTYPGEPSASKVVFPMVERGLRAWQVVLGQWRVVLDGSSGEVLLLRDESLNADARVFLENETANGGTTTIVPISNLGTATTLAGGANVSIANGAGALQVSASQQFRDALGDINFDDQMGYTHMDNMFTFFNGFGFAFPASARSVTTNDGTVSCNAAFLPPIIGVPIASRDTFVFSGASDGGCGGQCCRSAAHFADIIFHETTHRVLFVNNGVNFTQDESGAIHEGTSDYFSSTVTGNTCLAENFFCDDACLRNIQTDRLYPRHMDGESHEGGRVWASALWNLQEKLKKNTADRIIAEGMRGLPANPRFSDFAGNIIQQGTAFYSNLLGDSAWENFFLLLQIAVVAEGSKEVFCDHGIASPYGAFITRSVTTPDSDSTVDVTISVPSGRVIDTGRGCHGGFDVDATNGNSWEDLKQFNDTKGDFESFQETVSNSSLRVRISAGDGCGGGPPRSTVRYIVYHKAP